VEVHLKGLKPSEFHESPGKRGAREDDEYHETLPPKTNSWNWNPPPKLLEVFVGIVGGEPFSNFIKDYITTISKDPLLKLDVIEEGSPSGLGGSYFFLTTSSLQNSKTPSLW